MTLFNSLPKELESYILWLSAGALNLDIGTKKTQVNAELKTYKNPTAIFGTGFSLNPVSTYEKTPGLETIKYHFALRWLTAEFGISSRQYADTLHHLHR